MEHKSEDERKNNQNSTSGILPLPECGYTIIKSLGSGVFSSVFLAKRREGSQVVLKRISKKSSTFSWDSVDREVKAGRELMHDGVTKLLDFFETLDNVYLVFEHTSDGCDLFQWMEEKSWNVNERIVKQVFKQIVNALTYCHSKDVVHRDLKLENILIDNLGAVKLIDFGLCDWMNSPSQFCSSFVGSVEYCAPEILLEQPYSGFKADVWSCGIILYALLFGEFPYPPTAHKAFLQTGRYPLLQWPDKQSRTKFVSWSAKELVSLMLQADPAKRLSLEQVIAHKWVSGSSASTCSASAADIDLATVSVY